MTETTITLSDIAEAWADRRGLGVLGYHLSELDSSWLGATLADVDRWVANGFDGGEPLSLPDAAAEMHVPALEFDDEEGDLIYAAAIGGEDLYRAVWTNQPAPRGLSIKARVCFAALNDASAVTAFSEWLLSVIDGVERMGETPDVDLYITSLFTSGKEFTVNIPLRRAGEAMDAATWRALLAPGGYRLLVFLAAHMGAIKLGGRIAQSIPWPERIHRTYRTGAWGISLTDDDVLTIEPPIVLKNFNSDELTRRVNEVLA